MLFLKYYGELSAAVMMGCEFRQHRDVIKYIRAQVQTGRTQ